MALGTNEPAIESFCPIWFRSFAVGIFVGGLGVFAITTDDSVVSRLGNVFQIHSLDEPVSAEGGDPGHIAHTAVIPLPLPAIQPVNVALDEGSPQTPGKKPTDRVSHLLSRSIEQPALCVDDVNVSTNRYQDFFLKVHHPERRKHLAQKVQTLVNASLLDGCRHIFLDVGANLGVHVREVFEPQSYPRAPLLKLFEQHLGHPDLRTQPSHISGLCAVSFEGNPYFALRHQALERRYAERGIRFYAFTPTVVWTQPGLISFNLNWRTDWLHVGSSVVPRKSYKDKSTFHPTPLPSIDFPRFMKTQVVGRKLPESNGKSVLPPSVFMKMDIEGAEFDVVPAMLRQGLLCADAITYATIESHQRFFKGKDKPLWTTISDQVHKQPNCKGGPSPFVELDDESYGRDDINNPVPCK